MANRPTPVTGEHIAEKLAGVTPLRSAAVHDTDANTIVAGAPNGLIGAE